VSATARQYRLRFAHLDREIATREGETIYQSARRGGVRIIGACGGRGTCGTCMVRVTEGSVDRGRGRKWLAGLYFGTSPPTPRGAT